MKSLAVKVGVILIGLAIFGSAKVWGADWKLIAEPTIDIGPFYYDASSINRPSKDIVRVWEKQVHSAKSVSEYAEKLGKSFGMLSYTATYIEFNCKEKTSDILSIINFSKDGSILLSTQPHAEWTFINPESVFEILFEIVCKQMGRDVNPINPNQIR